MKVNVITLFSGYDSQCLALERLKRDYPDFDYDLVAWAEIDKASIKAHNALFPQWTDRNVGDVSEVDWQRWGEKHPERVDLLTYSSPCQDFSQAGVQRGGDELGGTRSALLWEVIRCVEVIRPRVLLFENVSALVSKKFVGVFNKWKVRLERYGYVNYPRLLNAKDYGVPQNRLRIFMVSIHGEHKSYVFPKPFRLERRLKDVLEKDVDERYYLSEERVKGLIISTEKEKEAGRGFEFRPKTDEDITANSVTTAAGTRKTDNFIIEPAMLSQVRTEEMKEERRRRKHDVGLRWGKKEMRPRSDGICNTLTSNISKDNLLLEQTVLGWSRDEHGNVIDRHPVEVANCVTSGKRDNTQNYAMEQFLLNGDREGDASTLITGHDRARNITEPKGGHKQMGVLGLVVDKRHQQDSVQHEDGISRCLVVGSHGNSSHFTKTAVVEGGRVRIRRLTERELFRLMDVDEPQIDILLNAGISQTQLAKMAGNSIVVACLYHIFRTLYIDREPAAGQQAMLF